jgi:hypothetical protein
VEKQPSTEHKELAQAAVNQYQSEECVRQLITVLRGCPLNDKTCLRFYTPMSKTCNRFSNLATEILSKQKSLNEL